MKGKGIKVRTKNWRRKPIYIPVIKKTIKNEWRYEEMRGEKKVALNIESYKDWKNTPLDDMIEEYREAKIYPEEEARNKIPSTTLKQVLKKIRVRIQPINSEKSFQIYQDGHLVLTTFAQLRELVQEHIEKILDRELAQNEKDDMVFRANTSKKFFQIKKYEEQETFEWLLEKYNFWECFQANGQELKFILCFKKLENQWKYLKEINQIHIESEGFEDQFSCAAIMEVYCEKEVVKAVIGKDGMFRLINLNGNNIHLTEAYKIDSITKRPVFYKIMLVEVCLSGENLLNEVPMFLIDVKDMNDLILTIKKNKSIGKIRQKHLQQGQAKRKRNMNVRDGLKFGMSLAKVRGGGETGRSKRREDNKDLIYLNPKLETSKFLIMDENGKMGEVEFRLMIKDVVIMVEVQEDQRITNEFLFHELYQYDFNDDLCCFYFVRGDEGNMVKFKILDKEDIEKLKQKLNNKYDLMELEKDIAEMKINLEVNTLESFKHNFWHFLDLCYIEWEPNLPYDESRNLTFNVRLKKDPYVLTFVKDAKEIVLRDERTTAFFQHKLDEISFLKVSANEPQLLSFKNLATNQKTEIKFETIRHKLLAETVILRAKQKGTSSLNGEKRVERYLKLFVSSWNTGDKPLPSMNDQPWLEKSLDCDLIAIGVQEANVKVAMQRVEEFFASKSMKVELVNNKALWHMGIMVYVKKRWVNYISNNVTGTKPTGIAGIGGNKGGITVSFKIHKTQFMFLNCHLAAGASQEKMNIRRANAFEILKSIRPYSKDIDMISGADYFFWVGDFNFRTDAFFDDVVKWSQLAEKGEGSFDKILEFDQLKIEQKRNTSFKQVFEGKINFKPTYRRKRDRNDIFSNKKNQSPSYTDRILIRHKPHLYFHIDYYHNVEEQLMSDHRPVVGVYYAQLIYNPIGFFAPGELQHELIRVDLKYAELNLNINSYFDSLAEYVPKSKITESIMLHLRFRFNDFVLNQHIVSSGTHFPHVADPNKDSYKFNYRDDDLPSLYLIYPEYKTYSFTSLAIQLAIKHPGDTQLTNIGFTDIRLRELFPETLEESSDLKMNQKLINIREKALMVDQFISLRQEERTIDVQGDVYFYSIKIGTIILGVEKHRLRLAQAENRRKRRKYSKY